MDKNFISKNRKILVLIFLVILSILMLSFGIGNPVMKAVSMVKVIVEPFTRLFSLIENQILTLGKSISEIDKLKKLLTEAEEKIREYEKRSKQVYEYENQIKILKNYLGLKSITEENEPYELVGCEVVSWGIQSYFKTIIVNKGSLDEIKVGMPVIAFQNGQKGVVGRIVEVSLSYSKIRPIHQTGSDIGALLEKERYVGIISGNGNLNELELNFIDKRSNISIGDRVLTLGENSAFPKGILIGTVSEIFPIESEFYKRAIVKPFIEIPKQHELFIIKLLPDAEIEELKGGE